MSAASSVHRHDMAITNDFDGLYFTVEEKETTWAQWAGMTMGSMSISLNSGLSGGESVRVAGSHW